jgi:S-adenosylmethionine-diacylglycerol 3-amino-3-carboxypropyl transferase
MSKNVDFSFIRYANGWEDTQLLIDNLNPQSGDKILSIAASGDNSLALLTQNPEIVVAFDINETQLFLTELKQMAIKVLEYPDVLELIGITHSTNRIKHFYSLKTIFILSKMDSSIKENLKIILEYFVLISFQ